MYLERTQTSSISLSQGLYLLSLISYIVLRYPIQQWVDTHFSNLTLHSLGLVIQLGHEGDHCPQPSTINCGFTVVDTTGIHTINLTFCNCLSPLPLHEQTQLLRASWLPASWDRPQTAFTFNMLNSFQLLNVLGGARKSAHTCFWKASATITTHESRLPHVAENRKKYIIGKN